VKPIIRLFSWFLLGCIFISLQGCNINIFGYQHNAVRATQSTEKGKGEVGLTSGIGGFVIPFGGVHGSYSPCKHVFVGANADMFYLTKDSVVDSRSSLFGLSGGRRVTYRNLKREGYAAGGNVGYYWGDDELTFTLEAGTQWEYVSRRFSELSEKDWYRYGTDTSSMKVAGTIRGQYIKPWAQFSCRLNMNPSLVHERYSLIAGVRIGQYHALRTERSLTVTDSGNRTPPQLPNPKEFRRSIDMLLGLEIMLDRFVFTLGGQASGGSDINGEGFWNSPRLNFMFGGTYTFGPKQKPTKSALLGY
jgi:hypothetical protein